MPQNLKKVFLLLGAILSLAMVAVGNWFHIFGDTYKVTPLANTVYADHDVGPPSTTSGGDGGGCGSGCDGGCSCSADC